MGLRKEVILAIKDELDGLTDEYNRTIHVQTTYFDPFQVPADDPTHGLPRFTIKGAPHIIRVNLYGASADHEDMRVELIGYDYAPKGSDMFLACEDLIQTILDQLINATTATTFRSVFANCGFSITRIGPIIAEQFDDIGHIAYLYIPISCIFLQ